MTRTPYGISRPTGSWRYTYRGCGPFQYDPDHTDPNEVATADKQAFIVEAVKEHKGNPKKPTGMTFWVKWEGYPEEENTSEPWKTMRLNGRLHEYLRANNLAKLVPKGY